MPCKLSFPQVKGVTARCLYVAIHTVENYELECRGWAKDMEMCPLWAGDKRWQTT
jgi:hypothetical protein